MLRYYRVRGIPYEYYKVSRYSVRRPRVASMIWDHLRVDSPQDVYRNAGQPGMMSVITLPLVYMAVTHCVP